MAMAEEGQDIFHGAGLCASCHLRQGVGGGLAPNLTDDVWLHIDGGYESIVQVILDGVQVPIEAPGSHAGARRIGDHRRAGARGRSLRLHTEPLNRIWKTDPTPETPTHAELAATIPPAPPDDDQ